jgi:hypothetical protein
MEEARAGATHRQSYRNLCRGSRDPVQEGQGLRIERIRAKQRGSFPRSLGVGLHPIPTGIRLDQIHKRSKTPGRWMEMRAPGSHDHARYDAGGTGRCGNSMPRLLLAQMRSADCIEQCPSSRAKRKTYARTEFFSVWTQSGHSAIRHPLKRINRGASFIRNSITSSGVLPRPSAAKFRVHQIRAFPAMTRCRSA